MPDAHPLRPHAKAWIAMEMAWTAAFVDVFCYLELHRVYTAHMSGNTASFGLHAAQGSAHDALRYGWAVASFVFGLLLSASMTQFERRHGLRAAFSVVLTLEVLLLVAFAAWSGAPELLAMFFAAAAMGMQTVTVTRVGTLRVYTTYVTGTLSKFAESVSAYAFWLHARTHGRVRQRLVKALRASPRQPAFQHAATTGALWAAYFVGAISGAWAHNTWDRRSLAAPIFLLILTIAADIYRPVALGDTGGEEAR